MKRMVVALICAVGLAASATTAHALSIGDGRYIGSVNDGIPSNPVDEVDYINTLIDQAPGSGNTLIGTETYNRQGSTIVTTGFPDAVTDDAVKEEDGDPGFDNSITATGFTYLIAKYDASQAGSLVWVVYGLQGNVTVPTTYNNKGLSHISLYNYCDDCDPPDVPSPDGGTTLMLLGSALVGLGVLRRTVRL